MELKGTSQEYVINESIDFPWLNIKHLEANNRATIVETAVDLYQRGLNVFPVPSPKEVMAWASANPQRNQYAKPPYFQKQMHYSRLHFCGKECEERRLKLHAGNCLPKHASFEELFKNTYYATTPNLAVMLGRTSGNLFVIDCDSQKAFETVYQEMGMRSIQYWGYQSGRGGGFLVRLIEGEAKNMAASKIKNVEVFGNCHYCILPPSLHPTGVFYSWISTAPILLSDNEQVPQVSVSDFTWLGLTLEKPQEKPSLPDIDLPPWAFKLSKTNLDFLLQGAVRGERNSRLFAAACDMAGIGVEYDEAEAYLLDACKRCKPPYMDTEVMTTIKSAYSQKRKPARRASETNLKKWQVALRFAGAYNWNCRKFTARVDKAAFFAVIERASRDALDEFRCTVREIAELANINKGTAQKALKRLCCDKNNLRPLLVLVRNGTDDKANYYRFSDYVMTFTDSVHDPSLEDLSVRKLQSAKPKTRAEQDVFARLGIYAWEIWKFLIQQPTSKRSEISQALGIPKHTVYRLLSAQGALLTYQLVEFNQVLDKYIGIDATEDELLVIADDMSMNGHAENRKNEHVRERQIRINLLLAKERDRWSNRVMEWENRQM